MSKSKKIKIISVAYENVKGEQHHAVKALEFDDKGKPKALQTCIIGQTKCKEGKIYRCLADPWGDPVWWETSENC
jgi:DNA helicase TIP49 (TBP-interacting protein)